MKEALLMPDGFRSLREIINSSPELDKIKTVIAESDVIVEFGKIFPELEKIVIPVKVEKKVLKLKVENSTWRSEIKFNEHSFVDKINSYFRENRINQIRFI
ncbi:MAG: DUF721 domain-containing protein [Ignavibacteriales bacterium]|nr:MAG: DUF721 domain-containing protein [Ignavibacteriales bacterium]